MVELQVSGMKCGGCAGRVTKAVQSVDGKATVDIELKSNTVRVYSTADIDQIKRALAEAGYHVIADDAQ